jgi:hypothetical protein
VIGSVGTPLSSTTYKVRYSQLIAKKLSVSLTLKIELPVDNIFAISCDGDEQQQQQQQQQQQ